MHCWDSEASDERLITVREPFVMVTAALMLLIFISPTNSLPIASSNTPNNISLIAPYRQGHFEHWAKTALLLIQRELSGQKVLL